jgi:integrase/recombinase XerD
MTDKTLIGLWVRRFILEHLVSERNLTQNTQQSYRDMLTLLLAFVSKKLKKSVDKLCIEDISSDIVRDFLLYLEQERGCSVATRNQRLAAIHALAQFVGRHSPEHITWCASIQAVSFKKTAKPVISYLEKSELDALLNVCDRKTEQGARDYSLLLFLYNTGARANEAAQLIINDLVMESSVPSVKIIGKAGKVRYCPLWPITCKVLSPFVNGRSPEDRVFLNCRNQPITRFGIHNLVKRSALKASHEVSSIARKQVSPHSIRHTTAVHLLRAGVDINTIRAWLGHVSLDTTNVYAEVDIEMKAKALSSCEIRGRYKTKKRWHGVQLMSFLKAL